MKKKTKEGLPEVALQPGTQQQLSSIPGNQGIYKKCRVVHFPLTVGMEIHWRIFYRA